MKKRRKVSEICIIGLGRYGQSVVDHLLTKSNDISLTLIDADEKNLTSFRNDVDKIYVADAADPKALQSIGLENCDAVVVATGDNVEIIATLQELGIKQIIARANNVRHSRVLKQIGVDVIISPEEEAGAKTALIVASQTFMSYSQNLDEVSDGFIVGSVYIKNKRISGKSIKDLNIRKLNISIVLIKRGKTSFLPEGNFTLMEGDMITVIGKVEDLNKGFEWFSKI
ncbi:potassium channel family protein [Mycoplasma phocoenae]|uniref:TrkA family potassium uptake protein n=1 Tax=Mycoplasma phocoenae TaxID=754517 RepID=A0A858U3P0_9MOLU|nr:TrkA family potassium uptake protein [Mycoplasma phocoenae]QJG67090.1 TrkA family potassium uptake protein [Mycoplasma phocoenae]